MPIRSAMDRPVALEEFMGALRGLRERSGAPSFRRMAAKSGAVSHATLHLAVTGYRLQPWETVREFVRACDGDEDGWHARWEETSRALASDEEDGGDPPEPGDPEGTDGGPPGPRRPWWRGARVLVPLAVVVLAAAVAVAVAVVKTRAGDEDRGARSADPHGMVYRNDAATFVRDVTYPDGARVKPDTDFVKVWELRNTGGVEWRNRYLQRVDVPIRRDDCGTPERIPINHTFPRQNVQITVTVRSPSQAPVDCKVRWKMVDASGRVLMPGYRPIFFDVRVRR